MAREIAARSGRAAAKTQRCTILCYDRREMGGVEGQLLAGKYRVERVLGQGGMGVVVAAHHTSLDEQVAIKFLLPGSVNDSGAVARFEREARAAVKIKSEHVARVTDVGRLDNGAPYMVMELLRGRDLGALLHDEGPLPVLQVADYALQAGEAIAEAHSLGIVHRDLKPANLFLTHRPDGSPCVKVLDFGISKLSNGPGRDQALTQTSAVMGSPLYMAPEQLMSARDVDARADVWSLGVICFELLTGTLPFGGETLPQLCMAISTAPPKRLRGLRPELPIELERLLLDCLEKDRERRVFSVAEFAERMARFAPPESRLSADRIARLAGGALVRPSVPARSLAAHSGRSFQSAIPAQDPHPAALPPQTVSEFGHTQLQPSSKKLRVGLSAGLVLLVVAALIAIAVRAARFASGPTLSDASASNGTASVPLSTSAAPSPLSTLPPIAPSPPIVAPLPSVVVPTESPIQVESHPAVIGGEPAHPAPLAKGAASPSPAHVALAPATRKTSELVPSPKPVEKAAEPASADCEVPYFFDARGNKVFKKGCL